MWRSSSPIRAPRRPRGRERGAARGSIALLAGLLLTFACGRPSRAPSRALLDLERLAFVPAGQTVPLFTPPGAVGRTFGVREPLLVDMYEVTRGDWRRWVAAQASSLPPECREHVAAWEPDSDRWPASFMTLEEAARYALERGMRLPTLDEWVVCTAGVLLRRYPWGNTGQESVANSLELGLERPSPVGTFESGRSPQWCYDLFGNVAEWVTEAPPPDALPGDERVLVLGGSYLTNLRPLFQRLGRGSELSAITLHPGSRAVDVGFRCAAPAEPFLWARAADLSDDPGVRDRLLAVGRRWGRAARPLLEDLASRPGASPALARLAEGARQ